MSDPGSSTSCPTTSPTSSGRPTPPASSRSAPSITKPWGTQCFSSLSQNPGTWTVIAVVAHYDDERAEEMIRSVVAESVINTYARTMDGFELGLFGHGTYRPFFPGDGAKSNAGDRIDIETAPR